MEAEKLNSNFILEEMDEESHHTREVYARYGLALYLSQAIERNVAHMLAVSAIKLEFGTNYEVRLNKFSKMTFGTMVKVWIEVFPNLKINSKLNAAVLSRNNLAHRYFFDRAAHLNLKDGRNFMLNELDSFIADFDDLDQRLTKFVWDHWKKIGLDEAHLDAIKVIELKNVLKSFKPYENE